MDAPTPTEVLHAESAMRLQSRRYGAINWLGLRTLLWREIWRFLKVGMQTVFAPLMSTILFMMVFSLAFGDRRWGLTSVPYADGLAAGLAMMAIITNAFQNAASSMVIAKVQGNSVDFLMPPLSALEHAIAFILGAAARGLLVGAASLVAVALFADVVPKNWFSAIYFGVCASVIFGAVGLIGGVLADKFDHLAAFTNFVVTPLTFLSGTFYSVDALPQPFSTISHYNPVFFLIDGFRSAFIGVSDAPLALSAVSAALIAAVLCWGSWALLKSGYRLKA